LDDEGNEEIGEEGEVEEVLRLPEVRPRPMTTCNAHLAFQRRRRPGMRHTLHA
jgi:hypothetical protein